MILSLFHSKLCLFGYQCHPVPGYLKLKASKRTYIPTKDDHTRKELGSFIVYKADPWLFKVYHADICSWNCRIFLGFIICVINLFGSDSKRVYTVIIIQHQKSRWISVDGCRSISMRIATDRTRVPKISYDIQLLVDECLHLNWSCMLNSPGRVKFPPSWAPNLQRGLSPETWHFAVSRIDTRRSGPLWRPHSGRPLRVGYRLRRISGDFAAWWVAGGERAVRLEPLA